MAAPTFVTSSAGASWGTSTTPKTTGALSPSSGDLLVSVLADENDDGTENYTWSSSVAETWTENTETPGTTNSDVFCQSARATASSGWAGGTVSVARAAGSASRFNHVTTVWSGHGGVDHVENSGALGTASPSYTFTTTGDNSALLLVASDWNARPAPTRTYSTINGISATELAYFTNAAAYTVVVAYWPDVGAAGTKTVQVSGFTAAVDMRMHVVEILGSTGGGTTVEGQAAASFGFTGAASGVPETFGTAAASLGFTGTAAGVDRALGVALAALGFTASSTGVDRALGTAAAAFGGTFAAQGTADTPPVTGQAVAAFGGTFTAAGLDRALGQAAASFGGTLAAAAVRRALGQALAQLGFTAAAAGTVEAPPGTGTASGSFGFTATAQGVDRALGQAAATFGFTGSASGAPRRAGAAASAFGFTAAAAGVDQVLGVAVAALGFAGSASGTSETPPVTGAAAAALAFTATASGRPRVVAVAVAAFGFTADGRGVNLSIVTPPERTLVVEAEDRLLVVPAEGRVLLVPPNTTQET